jgi:hypothetical protein
MLVFYTSKLFFESQWFNHINITKATICNNYNDYINSNDSFKVAFILHDGPDIGVDIEIIDRVSTYVFYFIDHPNWLLDLNIKKFNNTFWVTPGHFVSENKKQLLWNSWMQNIVNTYSNNNKFLSLLLELNPFVEKPKFFEILLGNFKPHRDKAANIVLNKLPQDKIIFSYLGDKHSPSSWQEPGIIRNGQGYESIYFNTPVPFFNIVPVSLYSQTAYTIVSETISNNNIILLSEKIAKPMLGKRLFITLSSPGFLKKLQQLGFQTFNNIIDESYDNILDENQRFSAAIDQAKYLCNENQDKILEKIRPMVEHNFQLLMYTNWDNLTANQINKLLNDYSKI